MILLNENEYYKLLTTYSLMKNSLLSSPISIILLLFVFACSGSKPVDVTHLFEREGLTYYNKHHSFFKGKGVKMPDTPFSGDAIKYWPTGEVEAKGIFKNGILVKSSYLSMDGTLLESTEKKGDTTIYIEWYSTGQKKFESKKVEGKVVSTNRWHEDGKIRKDLYDWEKESIKEDNYYSDSRRPLNYIIKKPKVNFEKQDVLFFMHGNGANLWKYENYLINQFSDNYVTVILQAPYEVSLMSNKWTWFDGYISFFSDTTFNEEQVNTSCESILFSVNKIIEKEKINPKRIFVGGQSQGGVMACKIALEHPDVIDGFIAHNTLLPIIYKAKTNKSDYSTLRGLVINGEYDKTIDPVNSKHIANTFLKLGADIQMTELKMGHEFPKLSRDVINEWMAQNN